MSTSLAAATSISATNAIILNEYMKNEECLKVLQNYDSHTATVQQMKDYSGCVARLHPSDMDANLILVIKIVIAISIIIGCLTSYSFHDRFSNIFDDVVIFAGSAVVAFGVLYLFALTIIFMFS